MTNVAKIAFLCLWLSACGASAITQTAENVPAEAIEVTPISCEQEATAFGALLASRPSPIRRGYAAEAFPFYPLSADAPEVFRDDLEAPDRQGTVFLIITDDQIFMHNEVVSMDELRARLANIASLQHLVPPPPFGIIASPQLSMTRISEVLAPVVALNEDGVFLMAQGPIPMEPRPCPPGLEQLCGPESRRQFELSDPEYTNFSSSSDPAVTARALGRATEACQPLRHLFLVAFLSISYNQDDDVFREDVADALIACDCQADLPLLQYYMLHVMGMFDPRPIRLRYPGVAVPGATVQEWVRVQPNPNWSVREYPQAHHNYQR